MEVGGNSKCVEIDFVPLFQATDNKDGMRSSKTRLNGGSGKTYSIQGGNTADGLFAIGDEDGVIDLTRPINNSEKSDLY